MKSILLTLSLLVSGLISINATPFTSSPLALDGAALTRTIVRPALYVNETITTHLVMPENIKLVDLSTDKIAGNQCADNIVRLKPSSAMENQQFIGTVTLVGERNIALYDLLYTKNPKEAATLYYVPTQHLSAYQNPSVKMSSKEIAQYAWAIFCSNRKFYNIKSKAYGVSMRVNNIYSVGDYFFIDFSLHNHTNVKYDIEELRVKLMDKKETKATNSQTIELTPEYLLFDTKTFKKDYRNVLVLKKLTFPEEKILLIEIYESQISGRTLQIPISYEDVLHADAISEDVINNLPMR
jgi:conjugative transposon TraN protein